MSKKVEVVEVAKWDAESSKSFSQAFQANYEMELGSMISVKEGKGGVKLSYMSWSYCQKYLKLIDGNASWRMIPNELDGSLIHNGFVKIELTIFNETVETYYPIMDNSNNTALRNPSANGEWFFYQKKTKYKAAGFTEPLTPFDIASISSSAAGKSSDS